MWQSARRSPSRLFFAVVAAVAFQGALPSTASATWSVIAADRSTGRVVIASATCVDRDDQFLMGVQAVVVPGLGVAACQAGVDNTHQNQMLVFRELQKGTEPNAIIELLSADPAFQMRQFGILDVQGPLTTTSSSCSRSTRCSTFPRWAPRRRPCAPRSSPRWRDTSAEKPRTSASSSAGQAEAA